MGKGNQLNLCDLNEEAALRAILEGTATETGERFFASLVENLAKALNVHGAWVTEYLDLGYRILGRVQAAEGTCLLAGWRICFRLRIGYLRHTL